MIGIDNVVIDIVLWYAYNVCVIAYITINIKFWLLYNYCVSLQSAISHRLLVRQKKRAKITKKSPIWPLNMTFWPLRWPQAVLKMALLNSPSSKSSIWIRDRVSSPSRSHFSPGLKLTLQTQITNPEIATFQSLSKGVYEAEGNALGKSMWSTESLNMTSHFPIRQ